MNTVARIVFFFLLTLPVFLLAQPAPRDLSEKIAVARNDSEALDAYTGIIKYFFLNSNDSARVYIEAGKKRFTADKYEKGIGKMYLQEGNLYQSLGNFPAAIKSYDRSLEICNKTDDRESAGIVINSIGTVEGRSGQYDKALNHFLEALRIFEKLGNNKQISNTYLKMGVLYDRTDNIDKALDYYKLADEYLSKTTPDPLGQAYILNNIGIIYARKKDYKAAIGYFEEGLKLSKTNEPGEVNCHLLLNAGIDYMYLKDMPAALDHLQRALELSRKISSLDNELQALENLAIIYTEKDPQKGLDYLDQAFEVNKTLAVNNNQYDLLDVKIGIDRRLGDYKTAYTDLIAKDSIKALIDEAQRTKAMEKLQAGFDLEKSKQKVKLLQLVNEKQSFYLKIIFAVASLLVISLVSIGFFYRKIARLNADLFRQQKELIESNTVKDKLFSIIGHDLRGPIGNIPMMLNMMKDNLVTEEEKAYLLDEMYDFSYSISGMLDKLLYWGQSQIRGAQSNKTNFDGKREIETILVIERVAANKKEIVLTDHTPAQILLYGDMNMFDFIIRNLVSNARKFTHQGGAIDISADDSKQEGFVVFCVKDTGVGIAKEKQDRLFKPSGIIERGTQQEKGTGLGLMLCKEFAVLNGGDIWMNSEPGKGSEFYFSFPRG